jgi:hypothetical protein
MTETVKTTQHVAFNEAMNDLDEKPPNAHLLDGICNQTLDFLNLDACMPNLVVTTQPFTKLSTVTMTFDSSPESSSPLGLTFNTCSQLCHTFVSQVDWHPVGHSLHGSHGKFTGSYIVSINDSPIFSIADVTQVVNCLHNDPGSPYQVKVILTPEC